MAVPKRKTTRSTTRARRSEWEATDPTLMTWPRCRSAKVPQVACTTCGYYNNRQVVAVRDR